MADVVICGAGMAGIATAHELAVRRGVRDVVLVDERAALSLTSDKGTEAYRNYWPSATMASFMNRSIDLLDELAASSGNAFDLNRNGYGYLTTDPAKAARMEREARAIMALGGGPVEFLTDVQARYPFLAPDAVFMVLAQRCGWLSARKLGEWLLARSAATLVNDRVVGFADGSVELASGQRIAAGAFVLAAGPHLGAMAARLGVDVPVFCELHGKMATVDERGVVPGDSPMMIWCDAIGAHPPGMHLRPRGREVLGIWSYDVAPVDPTWPLSFAPDYGTVVLGGLKRMVPSIAASVGAVDGGYYCKTPDNRPLIGRLPLDDAYVIGALSGYGIMGSQAAAELVASHVVGAELPDYAPAFAPARFDDPAYRASLDDSDATAGQL